MLVKLATQCPAELSHDRPALQQRVAELETANALRALDGLALDGFVHPKEFTFGQKGRSYVTRLPQEFWSDP